jgi:hypothetical protein
MGVVSQKLVIVKFKLAVADEEMYLLPLLSRWLSFSRWRQQRISHFLLFALAFPKRSFRIDLYYCHQNQADTTEQQQDLSPYNFLAGVSVLRGIFNC